MEILMLNLCVSSWREAQDGLWSIMEKVKAYITTELCGGFLTEKGSSLSIHTSTKCIANSSLILPTIEQTKKRTTMSDKDLDDNPTLNLHQQFYCRHQTQRRTSACSPTSDTIPLCYVCGGLGGYEPIRIRSNLERHKESYFPFLERHEAPFGVSHISPTQIYVKACMLCYCSLNEQWDAYERQNKPHLQRIYYLKRIDGKGYVGADITTQGDYAAQMLGLSVDHITTESSANLMNSHCGTQIPVSYLHQNVGPRIMFADCKQQQSVHGPLSEKQYEPLGDSPSLIKHEEQNYANLSMTQAVYGASQRNVSSEINYSDCRFQESTAACHKQLLPHTRSTRASNGIFIKRSSFTHHKFKLGQVSCSDLTSRSSNPPPSLQGVSPTYVLHQNQFHDYQKKLEKSVVLKKYQYQRQQSPTATNYHLNQKQSFSSNFISSIESVKPTFRSNLNEVGHVAIAGANEGQPAIFDLRNSKASISGTLNPRTSSANSLLYPVQVGILDLSMPDKNSSTEVCYVCGEVQHRGSLIELNTLKAKDSKNNDQPYLPIFNEQHPHPAHSRPKYSRGIIQACLLCLDHLIQQWNNYQTSGSSENERFYKFRKPSPPTTDRTTFVCYTCGCDSPSSQLNLAYCCPNAECEPYFPFIKIMDPFEKASPISPQGMVQICSSCNDEQSHLAVGCTSIASEATAPSITPSNNSFNDRQTL